MTMKFLSFIELKVVLDDAIHTTDGQPRFNERALASAWVH
jgi:hypothetical protein